MKKQYKFDYNFHEASVTFEVDIEKFTPEIANITLEFFMWDYDKENDPVDEVMNKYALESIKVAYFNNLNEKGVISDFDQKEGFAKIDGSMGILLTEISEYEFLENDLIVEIKIL